MKFNLVLSLIFFVICSTSCSEMEFKQICKEDIFDYNHIEVNSYFHFEQIIGFPKLNELLINETIKFEDWSKDAYEIGEMYQKKDEYNSLIKKFYTDRNVNSFSVSQFLNVKIKVMIIRDYFKTKANQANNETYQIIQNLFKFSLNNLNNLITLKRGRLNFEILPDNLPPYIYNEVLEHLTGNGIPAFGFFDEFYPNLYSNSIAKFRPIELDLEPDFENDIYNRLSIYIPVYKRNYNINEKCTNSVDLPKFFRKW